MEKNLGHATAYGYAKSKGYSGTEDEFAELMADYASVGQSAAQSAEQAAASATSASGSAASASQAAQTATSKASEAVTAAGTATTKASEANQSASTASAAATSASTSAQTATTAASTANTKASEAAVSANMATTAKTDAETARDAAAQSASRAEQSAESIDPDEFNRKIYAAFATDMATGAVASFADGADSIPMKDVLVHIEPVQEGSGDPSPDNVRPITGWTGAKVMRTGKNLLEPKFYDGLNYNVTAGSKLVTTLTDVTNTVTKTGNVYTKSGGAWNQNMSMMLPLGKAFVGQTLQFSGRVEANGFRSACYVTDADYIVKRKTNSMNEQPTWNITIGDGDAYLFWYMSSSNAGTLTLTEPQIELGSTATDYEPYSGQTYDITFPSEAGTVYGGTLDVTKGELIIDRAMVDLGTLDWTYLQNSAKTKYYFRTVNEITDAKISDDNIRNCVSDRYMITTWSTAVDNVSTNNSITFGWYGKSYIAVCDDAYTDAAEFTVAMDGVMLVYELATPITYTLTQQEITSLLGTNNVWADTGSSEVEYRADTKLYITKKITEAVSALS